MSKISTMKLASASKKRSNYDLSQSHLTTIDFGFCQPVYSKEMLPGDTFSVKQNTFVRMAPLVKPVFGKMDWHTATTFVPYCLVDDYFDDFITGESQKYGIKTDKALNFQYVTLMRALTENKYTTYLNGTKVEITNNLVTTGESEGTARYFYFHGDNSSSQATKYYFKDKGKVIFKWLRALGYDLNYCNAGSSTSTSDDISFGNIRLNAYPLLCAAKAYYDLFSRSSIYNLSALGTVLTKIKMRGARVDAGTSKDPLSEYGSITWPDLGIILNQIATIFFENDYFTSAWRSPDTVISGTQTNGSNMIYNTVKEPIYAPTVRFNWSNTTEGTSFEPFTDSSDVPYIQQRALDWLKRFDSYVKRGQYVGQKTINRIYQMFGINPKDMKSQYAELINKTTSTVTVGDVTVQSGVPAGSNVLTNEATVGDYGGKGIISDSGDYTFKADDYGQLITFAWLSVRPVYMKGLDKSILRNGALDFYNGDFDDLTANPISKLELWSSYDVPTDFDRQERKGTYGFTERYNEYRTGRDQITGDFETYDGTMSVWHFGRQFPVSVQAQTNQILDYLELDYNTGLSIRNIYDRIFGIQSGKSDHFYVTMYFDVNANRPIASLSEATGLMTDKDNEVDKNGSMLTN